VRERALADAALWRAHLDALIDARRARLEAGEDVPDDVLMRLLRSEDEAREPRLRGNAIRHNLLGSIMGWLPATSSTFARIVDELLHREEELVAALLEGPRIGRARGDTGRLNFTGPFPSGLTVRLGD